MVTEVLGQVRRPALPLPRRLTRLKRLPVIERLQRAYHHVRADALLISFPKSGRTWLRAMLGRALQQHYGAPPSCFLDTHRLCRLDRRIPYIYPTHDDQPQDKTAAGICRDKRRFRDKRVIFLVRDPRDVVVSLYFHKRFRRRREIAYRGELSDYVFEATGGIESIVAFYNAWAENRAVPRDFMMIRYEDITRDPVRELGRMLGFLGIDWLAEATIGEAADFASFDNLRRIEAADALAIGSLQTRDRENDDAYKIRRGKVGGYVDYLDEREIAYLDGVIRAELSDAFACYK